MKFNENLAGNELAEMMMTPAQFSITGATPCSATWKFTTNALEKLVVKCCREIIPEIESASFHPTSKGAVIVAVWLNGNCRHFINNKLQNTVINRQIREYSEDLKKFCDRYGLFMKKKGNIDGVILRPAKEDPRNLIGINIDLMKIIKVLFDADNAEFNKRFPSDERRQICQVIPTWHFKKYKDNNFDTIEYLEITKTEKLHNLKGAPKNIRSGKF